MGARAGAETQDELRVLVTGANSGLGFAICTRLIDEFLDTYPRSSRLVLILTTRSPAKSTDTINRLQAHLRRCWEHGDKLPVGSGVELDERVKFQPEQLDLTSLLSIRRLSRKLVDEEYGGHAIDVAILNAGMGGWTGLNWPLTIWTVLTDMPHAVTWPLFKVSGIAWLCKPQLPSSGTQETDKSRQVNGNGHIEVTAEMEEEPPLGEVFMSNVFGHYMLVHWLAPLLRKSNRGARAIWLSSLEAYAETLDMSDFQGLRSKTVYEQTKRITDLLVLSSELPSTRPWVHDYLSLKLTKSDHGADSTHNGAPAEQQQITTNGYEAASPRFYLSHPGICATAIISLPLILEWLMIGAFYVARWIGSPWHTCSSYKGAVAPVWLALSRPSVLAQSESDRDGRSRKGKWGSAIDQRGNERVARTEVEGWGWAGMMGEGAEWRSGMGRRARWRKAKDLTEEGRVGFEESGREVWAEMEGLRKDWERRLDEYEVKVGKE